MYGGRAAPPDVFKDNDPLPRTPMPTTQDAMAHTTPAALHTPADRYGTGTAPGRRRAMIAALGVLATCGIAVVVWLGLRSAAQPVRWKDVGFDIVSSERIDVTFEVTLDPGTSAVCTVNALTPTFAQAGTTDVQVGPLDSSTARYTVQVTTSEPATTGTVVGCEAP